ncbi:unnamed protein product [Allacma fusca]|uniref:Uncharacterized protein n=1 Tax=Allacma fusca TaxID=39272 RepID=A0A8J2JSB1_9HEXA|nr:unnamed protein product [Allacma fusca]
MRVSSCNTTSGRPFIRIVTEDTLDESVYDVCYESIDTVDGVLSEKTFIVTTNKPTKIYKFGNWLENDMAELVITRFMEVDSCSECSADTQFCCAEKSSNSFRCIFNNLTCNGFANCGFQENTDESRVTCGATLSAWNSLTLVPYLIIWMHKLYAES